MRCRSERKTPSSYAMLKVCRTKRSSVPRTGFPSTFGGLSSHFETRTVSCHYMNIVLVRSCQWRRKHNAHVPFGPPCYRFCQDIDPSRCYTAACTDASIPMMYLQTNLPSLTKIVEEVYRHRPIEPFDHIHLRAALCSDVISERLLADKFFYFAEGDANPPFCQHLGNVDHCSVGVIRLEKAHILQLFAEGGALSGVESAWLCDRPSLILAPSKSSEEVVMMCGVPTAPFIDIDGGCHGRRCCGIDRAWELVVTG